MGPWRPLGWQARQGPHRTAPSGHRLTPLQTRTRGQNQSFYFNFLPSQATVQQPYAQKHPSNYFRLTLNKSYKGKTQISDSSTVEEGSVLGFCSAQALSQRSLGPLPGRLVDSSVKGLITFYILSIIKRAGQISCLPRVRANDLLSPRRFGPPNVFFGCVGVSPYSKTSWHPKDSF